MKITNFLQRVVPTKPEGVPKSNWIQSIEGRDWLAALRIYGSGIEFFDQTWIPDDIIKIKKQAGLQANY